MGERKFVFNPFLGNFDEVEQDIVVVASDPVSGVSGVLYMVSGDPTKLWYFLGGNRYYITGTEDNPTFAFYFANGSTIFDFISGGEFDFVS